jgi:T-complex protein 1 subunit beta
LAVDSVLRLKGSGNLDYIKIIKKPGGCLGDSFIADGFILEKSISTGCAKVKRNCRVMVANTPMDHDKIKIMGSKVKVDSMAKVGEIEEAERRKMRNKIDRILAYKPDVFINRQLIYNLGILKIILRRILLPRVYLLIELCLVDRVLYL